MSEDFQNLISDLERVEFGNDCALMESLSLGDYCDKDLIHNNIVLDVLEDQIIIETEDSCPMVINHDEVTDRGEGVYLIKPKSCPIEIQLEVYEV